MLIKINGSPSDNDNMAHDIWLTEKWFTTKMINIMKGYRA